MNTKNPIICVDFDGVIHSYTSGWKGADVIPDPPVDGAIDWLIAHLPVPDALGMAPPYEGPEPVIYSARSSQRGGIKAMKEWFVRHGLSEWYIRDDILKFPETKPAAFLTLDDRAICFNGRFPTSEEMMGFMSWQKRGVAGEPLQKMSYAELADAHDKYMLRSVGAMAIAEGEEGWRMVPIDCPMLEAVAKLRMERDSLSFGSTGQFPDGKVNPEDEGEIQLGIAHNQDHVVINYGKPVAWLELPPNEARQFAEAILRHASQIRE